MCTRVTLKKYPNTVKYLVYDLFSTRCFVNQEAFPPTETDDLLCSDGYIFTSPSYPNNYPLFANNKYSIQAPEGKVVILNIIDFLLESDGRRVGQCSHNWDTFSVYNGADTTVPLIGKYCGSLIPASIESTGRDMYALFKSDYSITSRGFKVQVSFEDSKEGKK